MYTSACARSNGPTGPLRLPLKRPFVDVVPAYYAATRARRAVAVVDVEPLDQERERVMGLLIRQGATLVHWHPLSTADAGGVPPCRRCGRRPLGRLRRPLVRWMQCRRCASRYCGKCRSALAS